MPVKLNSSGGGSVTLDVPATATATSLTVPAASGTIVVADNSGNVTYSGATTFSGNATFNAGLVPSSSFLRNRIINGDMRIDQRRNGNSFSISASGDFVVDRWFAVEDTDGTMTAQRSTTAPAGFTNSLAFTTGTADSSLSASQHVIMGQQIEGVNVYDLGWGTASAQTVTLSFWARSSLTGTFGGSVRNSASNRSYPFTYSISTANTWEYKSVTIPGDTSGTWLTDTGIGIRLLFGLGVGSTFSGTAGSWSGSNFFSATGAVSVIGTASATWNITGVQLEVGSAATPFERRPFSTELMLCQRYYEKSYALDVVPGTNLGNNFGGFVGAVDPNPALNAITGGQFKVAKRATPTAAVWSQTGVSNEVSGWQDTGITRTVVSIGPDTVGITQVDLSSKPERLMRYQWAVTAEL